MTVGTCAVCRGARLCRVCCGAVSGSRGAVSGSRGAVSGSRGAVSGSRGAVSGSRGAVSGSRGAVSGSRGSVVASCHAVLRPIGAVEGCRWGRVALSGLEDREADQNAATNNEEGQNPGDDREGGIVGVRVDSDALRRCRHGLALCSRSWSDGGRGICRSA
ncbi:hypothetical protein [Schaalia dentiphila]|uniref:hypothetical protein n=1 Tax=Schaalia dentiphila TaxID=3050224 RepID=UPI003D776BBF